jgi:exonuclease SbcD
MVLEEIRRIADEEQVDFLLIAGDVFDTFNPSSEAVELLYSELKKLSVNSERPVLVIAGNHDSPDRIEAPDPLAAECGIFFIGYPDYIRHEKILSSGIIVRFPERGLMTINFPEKPEVRVITTPYANENRLRKFFDEGSKEQQLADLLSLKWKTLADGYCDEKGINIMTAHLFMAEKKDGNVQEPEEERSILHPGGLELIEKKRIPPNIHYTALGHLHRPSIIGPGESPAVYSGSPLAFGLGEQEQEKSVCVVEMEPAKAPVFKLHPVKSGRKIFRKSFPGVDDAVKWLGENRDCYVELVIECDKYISAEDRHRLYSSHDGITAIIPQSRGDRSLTGDESGKGVMPDLTASLEALFSLYFEYVKGTPPGDDMLELFREITSEAGAAE